MINDTKTILKELESIKSDLSYLKSHITDVDAVLTEDDLEALKEADEDFKRKKTVKL